MSRPASPNDRRSLLRFAAPLLLACAIAPLAGARQSGGPAAPPLGCGKARALAPFYYAGRLPADELRMHGRSGGGENVLPSDSDVLHCNLEIEVIPTMFTNLVGTNTLTIQSTTTALTQFEVRLRDQFTITDARVDGTPVLVTKVSPTTRRITLDRSYAFGEIFHLSIAYNGHAVSDGFGSIEFTTHNGASMVYTLSEPYYSLTWWPAKDGDVGLAGDNGDKFTLEMAVIAPDTMVTASNGLKVGEDSLSGSRKRTRWASDYPIAPYLVCFSTTNYNTWSKTYTALSGATMPVEFYIYPEYDNSGDRAAWEQCIDDLYIFRDLFGEYPFVDEKYGLYQCQFGGGMEHQTFTAIGGFWDYVIAHETGHQWWGDMITCKKWNDIWLNEGFASYCEALWVEYRGGGDDRASLKSYMDGKRYTGAGTVYVQDSELGNIGNIFDGDTTYNKGAWVLHMLRHVLGDTDFFAAMRAYRSAFEYSAAATEDFQASCEPFWGGSLDWFFQEWVFKERVPSYNWGWTTRKVNGKDYLLLDIDQTQSTSYQRFTMPIDIRVNGTVYVVWDDADFESFVVPLPAAATSVQFDPDAWVLNSGVTKTSYVPGPPKIVETSPQPGGVLSPSMSKQQIVVRFHTNVNAQATDFTLVGERSGPVALSVSQTTNVDTITLTPTSHALQPDRYTLTVNDAITAVDSGKLLDGEMTNPDSPAALPSGEGQPGGDAVIRFTVAPGPTLPRPR